MSEFYRAESPIGRPGLGPPSVPPVPTAPTVLADPLPLEDVGAA
jgi:hypothetical protein